MGIYEITFELFINLLKKVSRTPGFADNSLKSNYDSPSKCSRLVKLQ